MKTQSRNLFIKLLLITLLILAVARLVWFIVIFGQKSLQMDFSAYYTAGESLNNGLSPYENHISHDSPIWDGVNIFKHSRFLYPPLTATIFRALTLFPYKFAKYIWMFLNLLSLCFSLIITFKIIKLKMKLESVLIVSIFVSLYHPLLLLLERGQVDAITLVLIIFSFMFVLRYERRELIAGIILAFSTLFKLYIIFIVPFLFLRQKWKVIKGYAVGGAVILVLSLVLNGPRLNLDYFFNQCPRISKYGESGIRKMRLLRNSFDRQLAKTLFLEKEGVKYPLKFQFASNATLSRPFVPFLTKKGMDISISLFSLIIFSGFFFLMCVLHFFYLDKCRKFSQQKEFVYWQIILIIILLSGPLTWAMNTVWLLPIIIIVLHEYRLLQGKRQAVCLYLCVAGLTIAALPDYQSFSLLIPFCEGLLELKYVIAEVLLFISLLGMVKSREKTTNSANRQRAL